MRFIAYKRNISLSLLTIFIIGNFAIFGSFLFIPKKAEACQIFGTGPTCNFTLADVPRIVEKVIIGILERIAVNYANKYLTRLVSQISDKYRIRDFLFYDQYLSDYYLSNLIGKYTSDPNLRSAFQILNSIYISGQFQAFCSKKGTQGEVYKSEVECKTAGGTWKDPRGALIPQLKLKIDKYYQEHYGAPEVSIFQAPGETNYNYFQRMDTYYSNPPSFVAENIGNSFGAEQSSASAAAKLEVSLGNGLKAGRIIGGWCSNQDDNVSWGKSNGGKSWDPVSCGNAGGKWNASLVDQARNFITNPAQFIDKNIDKAFDRIFGNNFDVSNPYVQIGQFLGDFIFSKLDLKLSGNTLGDEGYDPNAYGYGTDASTLKRQVDLDNDGIPDGQNNSNPYDANNKLTQATDTCYHGGIPNRPPAGSPPNTSGCAKSGVSEARSPYFTNFCDAMDRAIDQIDYYEKYIREHRDKYIELKSEDEFKNDAYAIQWAEEGTLAENALNSLIEATKDLKLSDNFTIIFLRKLKKYTYYLNNINGSLYSEHDLDLEGFSWVQVFGGGDLGGGGSSNLISYTEDVRDWLKEHRKLIVDCEKPVLGDVPLTDPEGGDEDIPPPPPIGCGADPIPWSNEQWHSLFITLTAPFGTKNTTAAMAAIEPNLYPAVFQRSSSGQLRSRLYLPCSPINPWGRAVDVSTASCEDCGGDWTWIVR